MNLRNTAFLATLLKEHIVGSTYKGTDKHIFVHIPKTAGTSFTHLLYDNFGQKCIYPNYYQRIVVNGSGYIDNDLLKSNSVKLTKDKSWLLGHFTIGFGRSIWKDAKTYCFFREPRARILSNIVHLKLRSEKYQNQSIEDIYTSMIGLLGSQQARLLGYSMKRDNRKQVEHIINQLYFIGITEHYDQSIAWLEQHDGWKIHSKSENKGSYQKLNLESIRDRVNRDSYIDDFVYDYALALFHDRTANLKTI